MLLWVKPNISAVSMNLIENPNLDSTRRSEELKIIMHITNEKRINQSFLVPIVTVH